MSEPPRLTSYQAYVNAARCLGDLEYFLHSLNEFCQACPYEPEDLGKAIEIMKCTTRIHAKSSWYVRGPERGRYDWNDVWNPCIECDDRYLEIKDLFASICHSYGAFDMSPIPQPMPRRIHQSVFLRTMIMNLSQVSSSISQLKVLSMTGYLARLMTCDHRNPYSPRVPWQLVQHRVQSLLIRKVIILSTYDLCDEVEKHGGVERLFHLLRARCYVIDHRVASLVLNNV
jgi:hypothetical protein